MTLTGKRQTFVDEYLKCWNASEAARIAGYAAPGQQGHRLLKDVEISEEIQRHVSERAMSADEVLVRLAAMARADISDFVSFVPGVKGPYIDLEKAYAAGKLGLVKKLKYNELGGIEFELYDAQAALIQLGKVHRLFTDKQEVNAVVEDKTLDDEQRAERIAALLDRARARRSRQVTE